jgi:DNA-directed RNA polymerase subunit M/transcription elongation factor TFIIS
MKLLVKKLNLILLSSLIVILLFSLKCTYAQAAPKKNLPTQASSSYLDFSEQSKMASAGHAVHSEDHAHSKASKNSGICEICGHAHAHEQEQNPVIKKAHLEEEHSHHDHDHDTHHHDHDSHHHGHEHLPAGCPVCGHHHEHGHSHDEELQVGGMETLSIKYSQLKSKLIYTLGVAVCILVFGYIRRKV